MSQRAIIPVTFTKNQHGLIMNAAKGQGFYTSQFIRLCVLRCMNEIDPLLQTLRDELTWKKPNPNKKKKKRSKK